MSADANDDVVRTVTLPSLPGPTGPVVATRLPRVTDGLDFFAKLEDERPSPTASEAIGKLRAKVAAARDLLLGMGFPAEVVDNLSGGDTVRYATDFFLADLGLVVSSSAS